MNRWIIRTRFTAPSPTGFNTVQWHGETVAEMVAVAGKINKKSITKELVMHLYRFGRITICTCLFIMFLATQPFCAEMTEEELMAAWEKIPNYTEYVPSYQECIKHKAMFDDPRPIIKEWPLKDILPKGMWELLTHDVEKMKKEWAELVGFKAPDVVGKIAPEVKPGKYTYKDLATNPGLKELFIPNWVEYKIKPGVPPFAGNIPEFEIIPTRQYYWSLPVAEATKKNLGQTQLNSEGYYVSGTWKGGFPFPKPSGPQKAAQVIYNNNLGYTVTFSFGVNSIYMSPLLGFNSKMKIDNEGFMIIKHMGLQGRVTMPPFGYYDERAQKLDEIDLINLAWSAPRDLAGQVMQQTRYMDPEKPTLSLIYIPGLRRVRTLSGTDTQDPVGGQDVITDDINPKFSSKNFPWKFEIVADREYLIPALSLDGSEYCTSEKEGYILKNIKMERRPMYVVKLTQKDENYVYSTRYFYVDKELFYVWFTESYDQRGRLYRTQYIAAAFYPEAGMIDYFVAPSTARDYIDLHSNVTIPFIFPAKLDRSDIGVRGGIMAK